VDLKALTNNESVTDGPSKYGRDGWGFLNFLTDKITPPRPYLF
jgi:hypothetical protein